MIIKLPDQWYIGFSNRQNDNAPLGFMTPEGSDKAAVDRKATVDRWRDSSLSAKVIDNKSLLGFKLSDSIRRHSSWGNGNVKWRVTDPRGFELEISSANLMQILSCSTVEQGEIMDACVWGRENKDNILIPVTSDIYKKAILDTKRQSMKVSSKDIGIGNKVVLKNGKTCIYLGKWFVVEKEVVRKENLSTNTITLEDKLTVSKKAKFFFTYTDSKIILSVSSLNVAEIIEHSTLTDKECFDKIISIGSFGGITVSKTTDIQYSFRLEDCTSQFSDLIHGKEPDYFKSNCVYSRHNGTYVVSTSDGDFWFRVPYGYVSYFASAYNKWVSPPSGNKLEDYYISMLTQAFLRLKSPVNASLNNIELEATPVARSSMGYYMSSRDDERLDKITMDSITLLYKNPFTVQRYRIDITVDVGDQTIVFAY